MSADERVDAVAATATDVASPRARDGASPTPPAAELPDVDPAIYAGRATLAEGGMGRITTATDRRLARKVALKELVAPSDAARRRFERETLVTAQLQHPGIVPIYEAGRWPGGEPFYAMKLIEGRTLRDVLRDAGDLDARLALLPHVLAVADALAYAHEHGVIHRDLKPHNVLVGEFGETVVIDWGLAKQLDEADEPLAAHATDGELTVAGAVMGTPSYMPPEQARGEPVDATADVYAIGAILYHLLAGQPPYSGNSSAEVVAAVVHDAPPSLATRAKGVPRDLVAIVDKAMARDRRDRYASARTLADELRRFTTGRLVAAHQYTRGELVRRWLRRHRAAVTAIAAVIAISAIVGAISVRNVVAARDRAQAERRTAEAERAKADRARGEAVQRADSFYLAAAAEQLDRDPSRALATLGQLSPSADWRAARVLIADARSRGVVEREPLEGVVENVVYDAAGTTFVAASPTGNVVRWTRGGKSSLHHVAAIDALAMSRDGRIVAFVSPDGVRVWDGKSDPRVVLADASWEAVAVSPDASHVVAGGVAGLVVVDLATGERVQVAAASGFVHGIELSPDGREIAACTQGQLQRFALDGTPRGSTATPCIQPRYLPDGRLLAPGDGAWLVGPGTQTRKIGDDELQYVAVSRDGTQLATCLPGGVIAIGKPDAGWAPLTGAMMACNYGMAPTLAFSPDGKQLAVADGHRRVTLYDPATHQVSRVVSTQEPLSVVAFSPDGSRLAIGGDDAVLAVPTARSDTSIVRVYLDKVVDVRADASASLDGDVRAGRAMLGFGPLVGRPAIGRTRALGLGRDRRVRVGELASGAVKLLDGELGVTYVRPFADEILRQVRTARGTVSTVSHMVTHGDRAYGWFSVVALSADEQHAAAASSDHAVHVWDLATGAHRVLAGHTEIVLAIAYLPDGTLATGSADKTLRLWPAGGGAPRVVELPAAVESLAIAPDGRQLAAGTASGDVVLIEPATGAPQVLHGHREFVVRVAYSPDGKLVASAGEDQTIRLWDRTTGAARGVLRGHEGYVRAIAFSPDGDRLASASADDTVRLWDVRSGRARVLDHDRDCGAVAFTGDGRAVLAGCADDAVRAYADDLPFDAAALAAATVPRPFAPLP